MLALVLWSLLVLAIVGGIVFLVLRTKWKYQPQIPIRQTIEAAKAALKDKENWPKLYFTSDDKMEPELTPYHSLKQENLNQRGVYRMQWPHLDLQYSTRQKNEEVRLHLKGQDKEVTMLFVDGELATMTLGDEQFRREAFEIRQAITLADQFRKNLRKQLCSGYGGNERKKKAKDDSQKSNYEVNISGEIKLAELPPREN